MFYCNDCADFNDWPKSIGKSQGNCEICRRRGQVCNDVPSAALGRNGKGRPPWFRKPERPTLGELAVREDIDIAVLREAVRNRKVPIENGRVHENNVANVILGAREIQRKRAAA